MRKISGFAFFALLFVLVGCSSKEQTSDAQTETQTQEVAATGGEVTFSGQIVGAENMQLYFDEMFYTAFNPLEKTTIDAQGNFSLTLPNITEGVYRLRAGADFAFLILNGTEKNVTFKGTLNALQSFQYEVGGSPDSKLYKNIWLQMAALSSKGQLSEAAIATVVDTVSNPLIGAQISYKTLPIQMTFRYPDPEKIMKTHQAAMDKLRKKFGTTRYVSDYENDLAPVKAEWATQSVRIGTVAPDISLNSPSGKAYKLSDLKGKVVLLDFWASWCRPCRMNNPEVVRIYNQYKSKGFTVFSVSLDGVDEMTKSQRLRNDPVLVEQTLVQEREKWMAAIQQDNLSWEYHVSDLKKWDCQPAKAYGVTGIPKTYLLDKNGKIVAINPRGAELENTVKSLL